MLENEGIADAVCHHLRLEKSQSRITEWVTMVEKVKAATKKVTIGLVGKYVQLPDATTSPVAESLRHGGIPNDAEVDIR